MTFPQQRAYSRHFNKLLVEAIALAVFICKSVISNAKHPIFSINIYVELLPPCQLHLLPTYTGSLPCTA